MTTPVCIYCGGALKKQPQRKTKCPHCGEFVYVKRTPEDRTPRMMTAVQAEEAEARWAAHNKLQAASDDAQGFRLDVTALTARAKDGEDPLLVLREMLEPRAETGDHAALIGMLSTARTTAEVRSARDALIQSKLDDALAKGYRSVQLNAPGFTDCRRCRERSGLVIPATCPADCVTPADCPNVNREGRPFGCHLDVHPWIRRADGSGYADHPDKDPIPNRIEPIRLHGEPQPPAPAPSLPPMSSQSPAPAPLTPAEPRRPANWWQQLLLAIGWIPKK